jgi:hypothetical protein
MSTPPPHPGSAATLDRQPPAEARSGPPEPRGTRFGTHQVLWGLCGLIVGLAGGIVGTAAESPAPAAAAPASSLSAPATAGGRAAAARAPAAARPVATGTVMAGDGVFRIGPDRRAGDIRAGTWRTPGAIGGATGSCFVALLRRAGAASVLQSQIVTGPARVTTTPRTRAIRTSGCQPWHRVGS